MDVDEGAFSYVVPWSGEVVPVPIEAPPVPLPVIPPPQDWPKLLPNPAPAFRVAVHGAQYVWHDVWSATSGLFRSAVGGVEHAATITIDDVTNVAEQAISVAQTAWSSFITTLESAIYDTIDSVGHYAIEAALDARITAVELFDDIQAAESAAVAFAYDLAIAIDRDVANIERLLNLLPQSIIAGVEAWAIDAIYNPLLGEIQRVERDIGTLVGGAIDTIHTEIDDLTSPERIISIAGIGGILATLGGVLTWVDTCGEPMCDTFGPNTNLNKILKDLEGLLGLLAGVSLANMTLADVERLAGLFRVISADDATAFVHAFAGAGATIGSAGETIVSDLGHVAAEAFAQVSGL